MIKAVFTVMNNRLLAKDVWEMRLAGDTGAITAPGQFINIQLDGFYLRRPISICDWDDKGINIIYKVVGKGTAYMSKLPNGTKLDVLVGLGNGFDVTKSGERPLIIGGGVGVPPMYGLTKRLVQEGKKPVVIAGFNSKDDVFYTKEFADLGVDIYTATADGSFGIKGFVTTVMPMVGKTTYFYTCGPEPMLKAIYDVAKTDGQMSFEERMGCGFGACMGCSCKTKYGNKRICKDGPVLEKGEIIW